MHLSPCELEKSECHRQKIVPFNESGLSESRKIQEKKYTFTRCDFNAKYLEQIDNPDYVRILFWRTLITVRFQDHCTVNNKKKLRIQLLLNILSFLLAACRLTAKHLIALIIAPEPM